MYTECTECGTGESCRTREEKYTLIKCSLITSIEGFYKFLVLVCYLEIQLKLEAPIVIPCNNIETKASTSGVVAMTIVMYILGILRYTSYDDIRDTHTMFPAMTHEHHALVPDTRRVVCILSVLRENYVELERKIHLDRVLSDHFDRRFL